jgi:hypothetical protein
MLVVTSANPTSAAPLVPSAAGAGGSAGDAPSAAAGAGASFLVCSAVVLRAS